MYCARNNTACVVYMCARVCMFVYMCVHVCVRV